MNKSDLKDGMIVELRNGEELHILHDLLLRKDANMYIGVSSLYGYDRDLLMLNKCSEEDIIKVFDAQNNLVWERKEVDWSKVPFGTKVRCWNNEYESYEGKLLKYSPDRDYPFMLYYINNDVSSFKYCELIEDIKEQKVISMSDVYDERQKYCDKFNHFCEGCEYVKSEIQCGHKWIDDRFNITRK